MEGFVDVSSSTIQRPLSSPSSEHQLRTVHSVQDRSGMINRYLRLAFRINMEQLKLTEQDPLAPLPPLSENELEEIEVEEAAGERESGEVGAREVATDETRKDTDKRDADATLVPVEAVEVVEVESRIEDEEEDELGVEANAPTLKLHNLHNCIASENGATVDPPCGCDETRAAEKNADDACMSAPWQRPSRLAKRRAAAARIQVPGSPTFQGPPHDS